MTIGVVEAGCRPACGAMDRRASGSASSHTQTTNAERILLGTFDIDIVVDDIVALGKFPIDDVIS